MTSWPPLRKQHAAEIVALYLCLWLPGQVSSLLWLYYPSALQEQVFHALVGSVFDGLILLAVVGYTERTLTAIGVQRKFRESHLLVFIAVPVFYFVLVILYQIIVHPASSQALSRFNADMGSESVPIIAVSAFAAAFREEAFFRGYLTLRLSQIGFSPIATMCLSSILFAVGHVYQGWATIPLMFLFAMGMSWLYMRCWSIWPLVLGHATINTLLFLLYKHR